MSIPPFTFKNFAVSILKILSTRLDFIFLLTFVILGVTGHCTGNPTRSHYNAH